MWTTSYSSDVTPTWLVMVRVKLKTFIQSFFFSNLCYYFSSCGGLYKTIQVTSKSAVIKYRTNFVTAQYSYRNSLAIQLQNLFFVLQVCIFVS
jgi:hypothetical protein